MWSKIFVSAALLAAFLSPAHAATPTEAWSPFRSFIGSWSGSRAATDHSAKVVREYGSSANNQHVEITEKADGHSGVWGVLSFDEDKQGIVLRPLTIVGVASTLVFDPAASTDSRLVFTSPESDAVKTRISYELAGWNQFTERVERADSGGGFSLVSETRFKRR